MATEDAELRGMLNNLRKAKREAAYQTTWQGLGAFADAYRTGMPGIDALKARARPSTGTGLSASQRLEAIKTLGNWEKDYAFEATERGIKAREMEQTAFNYAIDGALGAAEAQIDASGKRGEGLLDREKLTLGDLREQEKRLTSLSDDEREGLANTFAPTGEVVEAIKDVALERVLTTEKLAYTEDGRLVDAAKEDVSTAKVAQVGSDVARLQAKLMKDVATGDAMADPELAPIVQQSALARMDQIEGLLNALPKGEDGSDGGARARLVEHLSKMTGIPVDRLIGSGEPGAGTLPTLSPEAAQEVRNSIQDRGIALDEGRKGQLRIGQAAIGAVESIGGDTSKVKEYTDQLTALAARPLGAEDAAPAAEAVGTPGGPQAPAPTAESVGATTAPIAPQAPGSTGEAPAGEPADGAQAALDESPQQRMWRAWGLEGLAPSSGIEMLTAFLEQAENAPHLPAIKLAQQTLLKSDQFKAWKEKNRYLTDTPAVLRQFQREMRASLKGATQHDDSRTVERVLGQDIGEGEVVVPKATSFKTRIQTLGRPRRHPSTDEPEDPQQPKEPVPVS